ncbi:hypothetical protein GOP47_0014623 [Adiantum capillus-veneris]|uniref:Uncharacterized protein n=1 Tax=Adiantum capillus-veneris TaxID=13818 RepID=A0A9D4UM14_ADICA|nr:hypothetical protein GOP47_0014623 [Adiantum capillus-veneris]
MASLAKLSNTVASASASTSSSFSYVSLLLKRPCFSASFASQPFLQQTIHGRASRRRPALHRELGFQILATAAEAPAATEQASDTQRVKDFLEELKSVGRIRIIVNTGVGVLESVTSLERLFYHTIAGRGEYANLMNKEENVDFHLLLNKVKSAKFAKGKSMTGDIPTYSIRFLDDEDKAAALFLVMWKPDTKGEYDEGQVEAFESLLSQHGDTYYFKQ